MDKQQKTFAIIGVSILAVIAGIVIYQFAEQQSAKQQLINSINDAKRSEDMDKMDAELMEKCSQIDVFLDENDTITNPEYEKCAKPIYDKYDFP